MKLQATSSWQPVDAWGEHRLVRGETASVVILHH